jgi:hypothetical protein
MSHQSTVIKLVSFQPNPDMGVKVVIDRAAQYYDRADLVQYVWSEILTTVMVTDLGRPITG